MDTPNPANTTLYQIIPSEVCFSCDVCCRFLEADSPLAPIFTETETEKAIVHGADPALFRPQADGKSAQIQLKPHNDSYICPFFEPETSHCTIYPIRPLDCQLYPTPFALMLSEDGNEVVLAWTPSARLAKHISKRKPFRSRSAMSSITSNPNRSPRRSSLTGASLATIKTP